MGSIPSSGTITKLIIMENPNKITLKSSNKDIAHMNFDVIRLKWDNDYLIYEDKFGRRWKLEPVISERIMFPFIITPLPKEGENK